MAINKHIEDARARQRELRTQLAADIIDEARVQLMLKFRFLDLALWKMDLMPVDVGAAYGVASNGRNVMFEPDRVIARMSESFDEVVRDYLHIVIHCVYKHPFVDTFPNKEAWGVVCDIICESSVMEICGSKFKCADDDLRQSELDELHMLAGKFVPSRLYDIVSGIMEMPDGSRYRGLGREKINLWRDLFERDDHYAWPTFNKNNGEGERDPNKREDVSESAGDVDADFERDEIMSQELLHESDKRKQEREQQNDKSGRISEESSASEQDRAQNSRDGRDGIDASTREAGGEKAEAPHEVDKTAKDEWDDIARQMQMNLESLSKEWGDSLSDMMLNLSVANKRRHDYTDFLRKFMTTGEETVINMDEFDYVYYTYGMELYGNLPLIEPLEYKDSNSLHDFVIVIDTSESVSGPLVKAFVEHTFNIMSDFGNFSSDACVHIIQCDSKVQSDTKVTNVADVSRFVDSFTIKGLGGTDFRPAFDYIRDLRAQGELKSLKGIVYFTDGLGMFPERAPDYDVAFVFVDNDGDMDTPVPPWASKIIIDDEQLREL